MLIVWFGPASAHISHFCEGFSIALAFYFRRQSTSKRWKFTGTLRLLWHHTLTTFSHELAQARLDWHHAYIMTSCARPCSPSCTLLPLNSPLLPLNSPLLPLNSPLLPLKKKGRTVPILLLPWLIFPHNYIYYLNFQNTKYSRITLVST